MTSDKKDNIITKQEKNYIVSRNESRIPQANKFIYIAFPIALGAFWWGLS